MNITINVTPEYGTRIEAYCSGLGIPYVSVVNVTMGPVWIYERTYGTLGNAKICMQLKKIRELAGQPFADNRAALDFTNNILEQCRNMAVTSTGGKWHIGATICDVDGSELSKIADIEDFVKADGVLSQIITVW